MLVYDSFPRFIKSKHYQRFIRAIVKRQEEKIWVSLASTNRISSNFDPISVTRTSTQINHNSLVSPAGASDLKLSVDANIQPTDTKSNTTDNPNLRHLVDKVSRSKDDLTESDDSKSSMESLDYLS
ncbi:hypothetical protein AAMO2058_000476100 [Amorphochlora amoebiformis]